MFSTCLELFFPVKNFAQCILEGREVEKNSKKRKKSHFFKIPKNISKSVQICFELTFFELFLTSAPWRSKLAEIRKKIEKIEFLKVSKNVLKSFQTSVELVLRYFSGKKYCPVHPPWMVETWKNVRKMEKHSFFFKMPKNVPQKVQTRFEHGLR